uniref:Uncharacterized protein n=1 Tax=Sphaeramia orbicularis TaxID=375764 RepID=A0A673BPY7_9TELE
MTWSVREAIRLQGQRLGGHEGVLHSMADQMTQLALRVSKLTRTQASASSQSVEPVTPVPSIQLIIEAQPRRFSNDSAKIAYVASLLEAGPYSSPCRGTSAPSSGRALPLLWTGWPSCGELSKEEQGYLW